MSSCKDSAAIPLCKMAVKSVSRNLDALTRICYTEYRMRIFCKFLRKTVHHRVTQAESRKADAAIRAAGKR